ncbi:hypothetical protein B0J11DRAFT_505876 [Dendryphion nanum]|uniref:Uncharacterized protein n=1 Tax=Dendryphion nanum TaxID=256645 RepID=A0A9P9DY72_9PLEO|nr:hypothetical protein B0J11DRAFT_505876 [Dendryphion nanum]
MNILLLRSARRDLVHEKLSIEDFYLDRLYSQHVFRDRVLCPQQASPGLESHPNNVGFQKQVLTNLVVALLVCVIFICILSSQYHVIFPLGNVIFSLIAVWVGAQVIGEVSGNSYFYVHLNCKENLAVLGLWKYHHYLSKKVMGHGIGRNHGRPPFAAEYLAVDVTAIDVKGLKEGVRIRSLPTRRIQLPVNDPSQVAVLSWRRDFKKGSGQDPSLNLV